MNAYEVVRADGQSVTVEAEAMMTVRNSVILYTLDEHSRQHDVASFYKPISVVKQL
jgi:hypothetical protein